MEWIKVEDKLPPAQEDVLFVATFGDTLMICFGFKADDDPELQMWFDKTDTDRDGGYIDVYTVTHWMPLPELPK